MMKNVKIKEIIQINGILELKTGLHIGGTKDNFTIGGVDSPVVTDLVRVNLNGKEELKFLPVIPGSSLKGKMRSLLELTTPGVIFSCRKQEEDCYKIGENWIRYKEEAQIIPKMFGVGAEGNNRFGIPRLIVRDAFPTAETIQIWEENEEIFRGTVIKGENTINRMTSHANPRFIERVPAGSKFEVTFVLVICEEDNKEELIKTLKRAIKLLEAHYLGGSGTRGYGRVKFTDEWKVSVIWSNDNNKKEEEVVKLWNQGDSNVSNNPKV